MVVRDKICKIYADEMARRTDLLVDTKVGLGQYYTLRWTGIGNRHEQGQSGTNSPIFWTRTFLEPLRLVKYNLVSSLT